MIGKAPRSLSPSDEAFLRTFPKVELHCHLEGSLPAATFIALAARHGLALPTADPEHVYDFDSFLGFLDLLGLVCRSMVTQDDFAEATYRSLEHAAACGIAYREMFWNVTNHPGVPYRTQLDGIVRGLEAATADHGITARLLPAINRRHGPAVAVELVEAVLDDRHDLVVGIAMDDDEDSAPPELFVEAYRLAGAAGLHRTAHAGEMGSAVNVATSLDLLGCERIDHGYGIVGDEALMERCRDTGVHFTGAWFVSTFHHGADPATTPIGRMIDAGLSVSINTDDPTMIPTAIADEYVGCASVLGLDRARMLQCCLDAVDAAWLDDIDRRDLRASVSAGAAAAMLSP